MRLYSLSLLPSAMNTPPHCSQYPCVTRPWGEERKVSGEMSRGQGGLVWCTREDEQVGGERKAMKITELVKMKSDEKEDAVDEDETRA